MNFSVIGQNAQIRYVMMNLSVVMKNALVSYGVVIKCVFSGKILLLQLEQQCWIYHLAEQLECYRGER